MKKILFILCMLPTLLWAQDDAKYLAGAVPVEDGYVTFRQTFKAPSLSQQDIDEFVRQNPGTKRLAEIFYKDDE